MGGVTDPQDLGREFVKRGNARDLDGVVSLYEPGAILALPDGRVAVGRKAIREFYADLLSKGVKFSGKQQAPLVSGDFALTSTRFKGGATAEVAHRQRDGAWLWIIDQPKISPGT